MSQEQLPTINGSGQRWPGIAVSCLLGAVCGLSLDKALREGAETGPTPGIIYWFVFIIASGLCIERNAFSKKLTTGDVFLFSLPGICVITVFVLPPTLMSLGHHEFNWEWALTLVGYSVIIFVLTVAFLIIASLSKPTLTGIVTKIFARTPKEIQQIGEIIEAAENVLGIVIGIIGTYIRFF